MGKLNLLKANYIGKVGQTVGAKWKNKSTIRTYSIPSNPNTEEQQSVRSVFGSMTAYVSLFSDQIKYLTALDTSGMSVRNAIIKLNKSQIESGTFDKTSLIISKGGLQKPTSLSVTNASGILTYSLAAVTATNFTSSAKAIFVAVQSDNSIVEVTTADVSEEEAISATGTVTFSTGDVIVYAYFLDYRGTAKIASLSVEASTTIS